MCIHEPNGLRENRTDSISEFLPGTEKRNLFPANNCAPASEYYVLPISAAKRSNEQHIRNVAVYQNRIIIPLDVPAK